MLLRAGHAVGHILRATYSTTALKNDLRALFRETAQPVVVVTSRMPHPTTSGETLSQGDASNLPPFHGATLSSFSSISLDPHPLVAFSLRIPSRMAKSLSQTAQGQPSQMVVNILSACQESLAARFSRPDLFPSPFDGLSYTLSDDGLPVLADSLGALSCTLVGRPLPLHDLKSLHRSLLDKDSDPTRSLPWTGEGNASELFLARVTRVENPARDATQTSDPSSVLPLIYHRRCYTSITSTGTTTSLHPHPAAPEKAVEPSSRGTITTGISSAKNNTNQEAVIAPSPQNM